MSQFYENSVNYRKILSELSGKSLLIFCSNSFIKFSTKGFSSSTSTELWLRKIESNNVVPDLGKPIIKINI